MTKKRNSRSGFSLMELLMFTLITIVTLAIAVEATIALNKDYKVLMSYLGSYLKGREAIDLISKDCRSAIRALDYYGAYVTTNSCLVLRTPSIDAAGNIINVNRYFDHVIYRINDGDLWKTVIPGSESKRPAYNHVLKKAVESLYMTYNGTPLSDIAHKSSVTHVTIWVSISETILGKKYSVNPGTTVKFMNYEWEFVR